MQNVFEDWKNYGGNSITASREFADINAKTIEELSEQYMALAKLLVETSTEQFGSFAQSKGYKEAVNFQTELVNDLNAKLMGIARNTSDIFIEHKEKCNEWFDENIKHASSITPSA